MADDDNHKSLTDEEEHVISVVRADHKSAPETGNKLKRAWRWVAAHKKVSIPLALVLLVGILGAVPATRYALAGTVLKQQVRFIVLDAETGKPVSSATVKLAGKTASTNGEGKVSLQVSVGKKQLAVSKKYYKTADRELLVPITKQKQPETIRVTATGRQITVNVTNKISSLPLEGVTIKAASTEAKTGKDGKAVMVLPADKPATAATLTYSGYNELKATIQVSGQTLVATNAFELTPSGKVYFLSNQSGKLDVVKTNLDGTERQVVLAGTGQEGDGNTFLQASRDWKYLVLQSRRDGGTYSKLFLIDTTNDKLSTIDEGQASFMLTGWSGHRLIYSVNRQSYPDWQAKKYALKSFDAETAKIMTLDESVGGGNSKDYYYQDTIENAYLFNDEILYAKGVRAMFTGFNPFNQTLDISMNTVKPDGSSKRAIYGRGILTKQSFLQPGFGSLYADFEVRTPKPSKFYYAYYEYVYEYKNKQHRDAPELTKNAYYQLPFDRYILSPSGKQTVVTESRDGKNALLLADSNGEGSKQVATINEFAPFGWYTDDYVLVSNSKGDMSIVAVNSGKMLKVSGQYPYGKLGLGYQAGY